MFQKPATLYSVPTILAIVITLLLTMATAASASQAGELEFKWRDSIDLNGDGLKEKISLHKVGDSGRFTLKIGRHQISGKLGDEVYGFAILDIKKADKYLEVAVYTPHNSGDGGEYMIFWYNGRKIAKVGDLSIWPTFKGNGIVYVKDWMGFWSRTTKYVLNRNSRTLRLVPQAFYYVGINVKVGKSFPLYKKTRIRRSEIVANLRANSEITILVCDCPVQNKGYNSEWYLIKSVTGLVGWTNSMENVIGLPYAD